ncbi:MAG: hypothetical protein R6V58_08210 [Planctomycetota bacterium]
MSDPISLCRKLAATSEIIYADLCGGSDDGPASADVRACWRRLPAEAREAVVSIELWEKPVVAGRIEREYEAVRKWSDLAEDTPAPVERLRYEHRLSLAVEDLLLTLRSLERLAAKLTVAEAEDAAATADMVPDADVLPEASAAPAPPRHQGKYGELLKVARKEPKATLTRIAALLNVSMRQLGRWRKNPDVQKAYPAFGNEIDAKQRSAGARLEIQKVADALRRAGFIS